MKDHLVTFAVGAGIILAAGQIQTYANTPGADGTPPLGATLTPYAGILGGGLLLVAAHAMLKGKV